MPNILSKLFSKFTVYHSLGLSSVIIILLFINNLIKSKKFKNQRALFDISSINNKLNENVKKYELSGTFMKNFLKFKRILMPKFFAQETLWITLIAGSVICRTMCEVWMVNFITKIESSIITRRKLEFKNGLRYIFLASPSLALMNNLLRFSISRLKLRFRSRLTDYFYGKYMKNNTFYQVINLDNRLKNVDQLLTEDINKFSISIVDLYANISKPLLDIFIYVYKIYSHAGFQPPLLMLMYLIISGAILIKLRKPVTRMTIKEQSNEGEYRFINSRLIANSEEIAFYQGSQKESQIIKNIFVRLINHLENLTEFRFLMGITDNVLTKYMATVFGLYSISLAFFKQNNPTLDKMSREEVTRYYYSTGRMMIKMAEAIGKLVMSGRQLASLAGYSVRINELDHVLTDMNTNVLHRDKSYKDSDISPPRSILVLQDNIIKFEDVLLITPNKDVLIRSLSFEVKSGCNVLICGPNGCGKSSLFRVLGGLWPQFGGKISKPDNNKLFYIPQKPYMSIGTLRDQVIYPESLKNTILTNYDDKYLDEIMTKVELEYIVTREGGWESIRDWSEVLSGGEKQRVAMARLFYHKPQFAILDECTSAVSVDVEGTLYNYCRELGITLFTVSHRKSLWKYHEFYLYMDGKGKYEFKPITEECEIFGS